MAATAGRRARMKSMKLISIALTGAFLMTALSACASGGQSVTVPTEAPATTTTESEKPTEAETTTTAESEKPSETTAETSAATTEVFKSSEIKVLGRLYQLEKTDKPTIQAVTIKAIPAGNTQDINSLPAASDGIRCIFDKDSFITINPTCPFDHNLKVTIVPHQKKASYYDKKFLKKKAKKFQTLELCDDNIGYPTAAFSLDGKKYGAGYYDVVFLKGSTPIAVFMIKIYPNAGIKNTGKDAKALMNEEIEKTKTAAAPTQKAKKKK